MTRDTPLMHVRSLLVANDDLPAVHAHVARGDPKEPALILVGLGGVGITGVSFDPKRNIDFIRVESRHRSFVQAERNLELAMTVMRGSDRLVAVEGTLTDFDADNEVYRLWATADIRR